MEKIDDKKWDEIPLVKKSSQRALEFTLNIKMQPHIKLQNSSIMKITLLLKIKMK